MPHGRRHRSSTFSALETMLGNMLAKQLLAAANEAGRSGN
jgi:hypothetical protein